MRLPISAVVFLLVLTLPHSLSAQEKYPQNVFAAPLDIPLILAGTFGELRSDHFHSGMDIKTQQREGLPVHSIADGTVTRILVSHWGYGKALYVAHPNGYTSVYAHLKKFGPQIQAYVKEQQYAKRSYQVELFPSYGDLRVSKGELIAYSGNTGGSAGPHLHFEIRSSISQRPTNPLLYGYEVRDATDPTLLGLFGYPLSKGAVVDGSGERTPLNFTKQADGSFLADKINAIGTIGFGVNAFDRLDMAANPNGLYRIKQSVDDTVNMELDFESFSFAQTRYINTLIDYQYLDARGQRIQKLFREPYNRLDIYGELHNDGKVEVLEGQSYLVEIELSDFAGNSTILRIPVEGKREAPKTPVVSQRTPDLVLSDRPNSFDLGAAKVYFPANTFYEDFYIRLEKGKDTVTIHDNSVAVHRNFTISFDPANHPPSERKQLFIAHLDDRGRPSHSTTHKRDGAFTTRTRTLGTYTLLRDSVPPQIVPKNFKDGQWLNNYSYLSLSITDDLSGIASYRALLDGEWILMEYEPKTNTITYDFADRTLEGTRHELKVTVTDQVGNSRILDLIFYRK